MRTSENAPFVPDSEKPNRLEADREIRWNFKIQKNELFSNLESAAYQQALKQHRLGEEYFKAVMDDIKIILSYQNEKGATFYTSVSIENGEVMSKNHYFQPILRRQEMGYIPRSMRRDSRSLFQFWRQPGGIQD